METLVQIPLAPLLIGTFLFGGIVGFVIGGILTASGADKAAEPNQSP